MEILLNLEEKDLLQLIIDNISYMVFWKDENLRFLGCNSLFAKEVNLASPSDIVGKTDFDLGLNHSIAEGYRDRDNAVIASGITQTYVMPAHDKVDEWLEVTKLPLKDKDGNILGIIGVIRDITAQVRTENKLIKTGEKYRTLIESTKTAYIILNQSLQIIDVNNVLVELLRLQPPELIKRNMRFLVHGKDITLFDMACEKLLRGELIQNLEISLICANKSMVDVSMTANLVENGEKKIICILRDISSKKKLEEAKYIQTEREKDRLKQNIVAIRSTFQKIIDN